MIRLRMTNTKPTIWLFGDESANDFRDEVKNLQDTDIDVRCFAYTGATIESVMDAQLLNAIGGGTQPAAIIVAVGAYDALLEAMSGGDAKSAAAQIETRIRRLKIALQIREMQNIPLLVHSSLGSETLCTRLGIPIDWAEQVRTMGCDEPLPGNAAPGVLEMLLVGLGCGKDSTHEPS